MRTTEELFILDAVSHAPSRQCAIDGGANIGEWMEILASHFLHVCAFEPFPAYFARLQERAVQYSHVECFSVALGPASGSGTLMHDKKHCPWVRFGEGETPMLAIDDLDLPQVGLIKLDLEGGEYHALLGAEKTIKRDKPVVIVEIDPKFAPRRYNKLSPTAASDLLASWGMVCFASENKDLAFQFPTKGKQ